MSDQKRKTDPPLYLDLDFEDALSRFARVRPGEVKDSVERAKQKKKPPDGNATRRRPQKGGSS